MKLADREPADQAATPQPMATSVGEQASLPCRTSPDGYHCSCTHAELGGYECCYMCFEPCVESVR